MSPSDSSRRHFHPSFGSKRRPLIVPRLIPLFIRHASQRGLDLKYSRVRISLIFLVSSSSRPPMQTVAISSRSGESNPGPTHYECVALPSELPRRGLFPVYSESGCLGILPRPGRGLDLDLPPQMIARVPRVPGRECALARACIGARWDEVGRQLPALVVITQSGRLAEAIGYGQAFGRGS